MHVCSSVYNIYICCIHIPLCTCLRPHTYEGSRQVLSCAPGGHCQQAGRESKESCALLASPHFIDRRVRSSSFLFSLLLLTAQSTETFVATIDESGELRVHLLETEIFSFPPRLAVGTEARVEDERREKTKSKALSSASLSSPSISSVKVASTHEAEEKKEGGEEEKQNTAKLFPDGEDDGRPSQCGTSEHPPETQGGTHGLSEQIQTERYRG